MPQNPSRINGLLGRLKTIVAKSSFLDTNAWAPRIEYLQKESADSAVETRSLGTEALLNAKQPASHHFRRRR